MTQVVLTGNRYLKGQSYPTIDSELVVEIKQGSTWDEDFYAPGDFSSWDISFYISKNFAGDRMAVGRVAGVSFGDFTEPILDENGNPVLDENGNPTSELLEDYTYFRVIIDSDVTALMEISPISLKEIESPKAGKDYWWADLEASRNNGGVMEVEPLYLDLTPVVVRGQV